MTRYRGVGGQDLPPSPYVASGAELAAVLRAAAALAEQLGDMTPVQIAPTLYVDVLECTGRPTQRRAVITDLSRVLAGTGVTAVHCEDDVLLLQTAETKRQAGRLEVIACGVVPAKATGGRS